MQRARPGHSDALFAIHPGSQLGLTPLAAAPPPRCPTPRSPDRRCRRRAPGPAPPSSSGSATTTQCGSTRPAPPRWRWARGALWSATWCVRCAMCDVHAVYTCCVCCMRTVRAVTGMMRCALCARLLAGVLCGGCAALCMLVHVLCKLVEGWAPACGARVAWQGTHAARAERAERAHGLAAASQCRNRKILKKALNPK